MRWQLGSGCLILLDMDTVPHTDADTPDTQTDAQRVRRLAWEADRIAEADADIAAGRLVNSAEVKAWIDSLGTEHELPIPYAGN